MQSTQESSAPSRREVRRNDRRDAIIAVAYAYFLEHGYAATSMSGIAATIGGSKATLWNYFPSKEALFEAVVDHATTKFRLEMSAALNSDGEMEAGLRGFAQRFVEKVTMPSALALQRLVHTEVGRFPEIGEIFYERGPRTTYRILAAFIASAMERGQLRSDDPMKAAKMLTAMCLGGCQQRLLLSMVDPRDPETIADETNAAVDLFLRAYAPD